MKRRCGSILALGALATCLAGTGLAAGQATSSGFHEFTMTAKNYEFDPGVITVKKGEKVRLIITATDRDHGIKIDAFDINQVLKKGDPTTIVRKNRKAAPAMGCAETGPTPTARPR